MLGIGRGVQWYALHVLKVHVELLALRRFVLLAVEEGDLLESRMQVLLDHLDDLVEGGPHLRVVLPTHLHEAVPERRVRAREDNLKPPKPHSPCVSP